MPSTSPQMNHTWEECIDGLALGVEQVQIGGFNHGSKFLGYQV